MTPVPNESGEQGLSNGSGFVKNGSLLTKSWHHKVYQLFPELCHLLVRLLLFMYMKLMVSQIVLANELFHEQWVLWLSTTTISHLL